jgi:hypothetical protein
MGKPIYQLERRLRESPRYRNSTGPERRQLLARFWAWCDRADD